MWAFCSHIEWKLVISVTAWWLAIAIILYEYGCEMCYRRRWEFYSDVSNTRIRDKSMCNPHLSVMSFVSYFWYKHNAVHKWMPNVNTILGIFWPIQAPTIRSRLNSDNSSNLDMGSLIVVHTNSILIYVRAFPWRQYSWCNLPYNFWPISIKRCIRSSPLYRCDNLNW